ncbi:hypothetical protein [Baaleninema simplex]|uniref:hypothetical protein n=1 Tax=Baaleninema simplex TaxID=2862350 RepID=UPI000347EC72|nr:hypothetical protein [Baaleninema simplex]
MTSTLAIERLTLYDLEERFGLQEECDLAFFSEWHGMQLQLSDSERERLARICAGYANLERRGLLEKTVELLVLAPLLDLAGFFLPPFYIETEKPVRVKATDGSMMISGRLDVLVVCDRLWILVIESKRGEFSLKVGIPQVLGYMLSAEKPQPVRYGMVTNGESFQFLKLSMGETPRYGRSNTFLLGQDAGLETTLQILKYLATLLVAE